MDLRIQEKAMVSSYAYNRKLQFKLIVKND